MGVSWHLQGSSAAYGFMGAPTDTFGSFHRQDNLIWQTEQRQSNNSLPYLVQVYITGQTPNYTAAVENGGWDPYSNAFPALPGEVLDIVWLSNSGPTGGWDFHPMHAHGKHYFDLGSG